MKPAIWPLVRQRAARCCVASALIPKQRAAGAALIETVEHNQPCRASASASENRTGQPRERAYAALWRAYPNQTYEGDAPEVFYQLLDEGVDPDVLIAGAAAYAKRCEGIDPKNIKLLCYWLRVKGWDDKNSHLSRTTAQSAPFDLQRDVPRQRGTAYAIKPIGRYYKKAARLH